MKKYLLVSVCIVLFVVGCQKKEDSTAYYGTYQEILTGELDGDYFDDFESVPLENAQNEGSVVRLKSNGIYEAEHRYYGKKSGELYSIVTNKYEYTFKENEIIRNRDITMDNFKSFDKIFKYEGSDELRVTDEYIEKIEMYGATIVKEEDDYVIYERTAYKVENNDSDRPENHLEHDYINKEGQMVSINYYKDEDRTAVTIYEKIN